MNIINNCKLKFCYLINYLHQELNQNDFAYKI